MRIALRAPKDKDEAIDLWQRGRFGNYIRQWQNPVEFFADESYGGTAVIRYKAPPGGRGPCVYDVSREALDTVWQSLAYTHKWDENRLYINETMPKHKLLVQGELVLNETGWHFFGSTAKVHMRDALREHGRNWTGAAAYYLLRSRMDPSSWEDLQALIEEWPDAVFELSVYDTTVGAVPNRNTVIWEARGY